MESKIVKFSILGPNVLKTKIEKAELLINSFRRHKKGIQDLNIKCSQFTNKCQLYLKIAFINEFLSRL